MEVAVIILGLFIVLLVVVIYHLGRKLRAKDNQIKAIKALKDNTVNDSYCKENCKGYQETGKCYADWDCEAKRKAEQNLAWSEEDEEQVSIITNIVQAHCGKLIDCCANLKWLKSLKERLSL